MEALSLINRERCSCVPCRLDGVCTPSPTRSKCRFWLLSNWTKQCFTWFPFDAYRGKGDLEKYEIQ